MSIDGSIVHDYWRAIAGESQPPTELTGDTMTDFVALLLPEAGAEGFPEAALRRRESSPLEVYGKIAVADDPAAEMSIWAADVAELVAFSCPALPRHVWYLDKIVDDAGNHRVYAFIDHELAREFASIEDALRYLTTFILYSERRCGREETVEVEASLSSPAPWSWSGAHVFAMLRALPLPEMYKAWSFRSWLVYDAQSTTGLDTAGPGASRVAMLAAVETMMRTRSLDTRNVDYSQMVDAHRFVVDQLRQLAKAVSAGYPPKIIAELARGDNPELAQLAGAWLARFEASEDTADTDLAPPDSDQSKALRLVLARALDELVAKELIELEEGSREPLVDELSLAVLEAFNPNHAVKKLRFVLLSSDHVAEVYAADLVLDSAFREALGG